MVVMNLISRPAPLTPIVHLLPIQNAQANSDFIFDLKPFIKTSNPEVVYRVTNQTTNLRGETKELFATSLGFGGLPAGFKQAPRQLGDCDMPLSLGEHASCVLRFYLNMDEYTSLQGGNGPIIWVQMSWLWGSHYNRHGGEQVMVYPFAPHTIQALFAPLMRQTDAIVTPVEQAGLHYDAATQSIVGKPNHTGTYHFTVEAVNGSARAAPQDLQINVQANLQDTPILKPYYTLASAMPKQGYQLNLMDVLEPNASFMSTNQVQFRLDEHSHHPQWLSLDKDNPTLLKGQVPSTEAGQINEVTVIATSNTGGDSQPMTIQIPVAYDLSKRAIIRSDFELKTAAGLRLNKDLYPYLTDFTSDGSLKIILDKTEPAAPWLSISSTDHVSLNGLVPKDAVGQTFQLTLHANTAVGGDSERVTVPLTIAIDESKTPKLYPEKPDLPPLYKGQCYFYDFNDCSAITPEYRLIPYFVELERGYDNPDWLRIESNRLIADDVPRDAQNKQRVFFSIKNTPGGQSKIYYVDLDVI